MEVRVWAGGKAIPWTSLRMTATHLGQNDQVTEDTDHTQEHTGLEVQGQEKKGLIRNHIRDRTGHIHDRKDRIRDRTDREDPDIDHTRELLMSENGQVASAKEGGRDVLLRVERRTSGGIGGEETENWHGDKYNRKGTATMWRT